MPIPPSATRHGITDETVAGAPRFADVVDKLAHTLASRRIPNASYDKAVLRYEIGQLNIGESDEADAAEACMGGAVSWKDAMDPYAIWYGDWSDYWQSYTWLKLGGGHRAAGDCFAVVDCIGAMALGK